MTAGPAVASPAPVAAPKGSCKLITVRQVGSILGTQPRAGKQKTRTGSGQGNDQCVWSAKKKGTGGVEGQPLQLELVVESGPGLVDDYNLAKAAGSTPSQKVPVLGDEAFIKDLKLHALVGDRVVTASLHNYRYPKPLAEQLIQQKDQEAVKIALGRLT